MTYGVYDVCVCVCVCATEFPTKLIRFGTSTDSKRQPFDKVSNLNFIILGDYII